MRHAIRFVIIAAATCIALSAVSRASGQEAAAGVVTPDARIADLAVFRRDYLARERAFTPEARAEAEARLSALEASAGQISSVYFELELARIVALADNGHSAVFAGPRSRRYNRVAIRLAPFGEDFHVVRAKVDQADLLGARLTAIDGRPVEELRTLARSLAGGLNHWRDRNANYLFESPQQLHALGAADAPSDAQYRFEYPDGTIVERRLLPDGPDPNRPRVQTHRVLFPAPMQGEGPEWRTLISTDQAPWSLQDPETPFRWRRAPEIDGIVIELRQNQDADSRPIASALREFESAIRTEHPLNLVVDMRFNGGGDLNTTRAFMRELPELVTGRIFALTSPWTFSAAISSVAYLKQASPERVTIVGEHVGDRLVMFSEGSLVTLPNTQILMMNSRERHDYQTGCRGFSDCHRSVVRHPISLPTLAPEIQAPLTIEAYRGGRDPAIEAIVAARR